jgi:hypothetical protein
MDEKICPTCHQPIDETVVPFETEGLREELRALAARAGFCPPKVKALGLWLKENEERIAASIL